MHKLLARQLRRHLGDPVDLPKGWEAFLSVIDEAYKQADADRLLLERSIELVSQELMQRNEALRQDIAQRKLTEEALESSISILQGTLESTADGILVINREGKIISFNRKFVEMWGIPDEIMDSQDDSRALAFVLDQLQTPQEFLSKVKGLYAQPDAESYDILEFKDGRIVERYSQPQRISGKSVGRVWSFRDITEQKRAEDRLARLNKTFLSLGLDFHRNITLLTEACGELLSATYALYSRLEGDLLHVIGQWNTPSDYQSIDQADGHICHDLMTKETSPGFFVVRDLSSTSYARTDPNVARYGLKTYVGHRVRCFGQPIGSLCVMYQHDVVPTPSDRRVLEIVATAIGVEEDRRRVEETMAQQAKELVHSNAELEQFAYVASHDLQEPLRMVASYTQLLAKRYKGKLDSDADEFIGYAVQGAIHMQRLLTDLLVYSRVGTKGKSFAPTDCEALLGATLTNLKIAIEERGAVITHEPLPTVMGDDVQLGQLLQNLIGNAMKFCKGQAPTIHLRATPQDDGMWRFAVQDNGVGIDSKYRERIFIIFQRLHTSEEYPGTGIGLAICKKIVERHGGRIWVESAVGQGSTFYCTLPRDVGNGGA